MNAKKKLYRWESQDSWLHRKHKLVYNCEKEEAIFVVDICYTCCRSTISIWKVPIDCNNEQAQKNRLEKACPQ